jgi:hypothetical protein
MDTALNYTEELPALQQPALPPIAVPPAQTRNFAARCSHPFVGTIPELLPIHGAPTPAPVFGFFLGVLVVLTLGVLVVLIDSLITTVYGQIPGIGFLFVLTIIIKVIQCATALHQENQTLRRDQTHSRTGYVPPNARQRPQERQHILTPEEEANQKICRQEQEEHETDEEIAQKVRGHLTQMFQAGELASAEGISFSEALQRVSSNGQEVQQDNKSKGKGKGKDTSDT